MDEIKRLEELYAYNILDTPPEKELDDVVELAAAICGTPIAQITLIDRTRQWIKATHGMPGVECPRELSFCHQMNGQKERIMEVPDSLEDDRFKDNPHVTGEPGVRFYAGSSLITPTGFFLGALCVIDTKPNKLSPIAKRMLKILTDRVMHHLELLKLNNALKRELNLFESKRIKGGTEASARYTDLLEEVIFSISHSIRGPVTTLEGLVNLMMIHENLDGPTILAYCERIESSVKQLSHHTSVLTKLLDERRKNF